MSNHVEIDNVKFYPVKVCSLSNHRNSDWFTHFEDCFVTFSSSENGAPEEIIGTASSPKEIRAKAVFFKYLAASFFKGTIVYASFERKEDGTAIKSILPKLIPIANENDEKRARETKLFDVIE